jgi:murein lipoprotein
MMMMSKTLKLSAIALSTAAVMGCVSTKDLEAVRATAEQARSDASAAQSTANTALATAEDARSIANQALSASQATDERLNRMFKRSMLK